MIVQMRQMCSAHSVLFFCASDYRHQKEAVTLFPVPFASDAAVTADLSSYNNWNESSSLTQLCGQ